MADYNLCQNISWHVKIFGNNERLIKKSINIYQVVLKSEGGRRRNKGYYPSFEKKKKSCIVLHC